MITTTFGVVEKSEHGPTKARAQRLFDDTELLTAECLLIVADRQS
jgi:hypothetical protein